MNEVRSYWPALKLARAGHHLKVLKQEIEGCLEADSKGVVTDFESEPGYMILKAYLRREPSPMCSLQIGEILYHLRSVLDYLVCYLTEKNGQVVDNKVEFPIFLRREDFCDDRDDLKAPILRRIGGLTPEDQAFIGWEQPFQRKYGSPEDDPLAMLYTLSNFDRHQFLHLVTVIAKYTFSDFFPPSASSLLEQVSTTYGPFKNDTEVARFRIRNYVGPESRVQVNSYVTFEIVFGQAGPCVGRPVLETLSAIGERVARLIAPFFDAPDSSHD
jgi:hypothetical protein